MPRLPPKPRTGLAGRLTEARRFRGLTQQRLGELCGTSQAVIQKIENGRSLLPRNINKIAEVLDVPVEWLMYGVVGEAAGLDVALALGFVARR